MVKAIYMNGAIFRLCLKQGPSSKMISVYTALKAPTNVCNNSISFTLLLVINLIVFPHLIIIYLLV